MSKATERPAPRQQSAERRWYESGIRDQDAEAAYFKAEKARIDYEMMELRTGPRGRRTYDFAEEVEQESAAWLIEEVSDWAQESPSKPIVVRINTPGGDEISGLAIVDFLRSLTCRVITLGIGEVSSMGSVLLQAGDVRYLTRHAVMLIHESRTFGGPIMEKLSDMPARLALGQMLERSCNELLAERSAFADADALAEHYGSKDWWLGAEDAVSYGFADEIVPDGA